MIRKTLTEEQQARAVQIALDVRARASEAYERFARPDEREAVAKRIDPETARCFWQYGYVVDPYGDDPDLPDEAKCRGREWFAVGPDGVAVARRDLPEETLEALRSAGWRL